MIRISASGSVCTATPGGARPRVVVLVDCRPFTLTPAQSAAFRAQLEAAERAAIDAFALVEVFGELASAAPEGTA